MSVGSPPEPADPLRRIEIWVDDAHWWLTQDDGQLQVADICFTNFSYNRITFSNDSGEHRLELGTFSVRNLMPNTRSIYQVSGVVFKFNGVVSLCLNFKLWTLTVPPISTCMRRESLNIQCHSFPPLCWYLWCTSCFSHQPTHPHTSINSKCSVPMIPMPSIFVWTRTSVWGCIVRTKHLVSLCNSCVYTTMNLRLSYHILSIITFKHLLLYSYKHHLRFVLIDGNLASCLATGVHFTVLTISELFPNCQPPFITSSNSFHKSWYWPCLVLWVLAYCIFPYVIGTVAGISVKEHLEVNVVPLSVSLTAKFYQTMQDFFFPKADERIGDQQEPDHAHLFGPSGIQRKSHWLSFWHYWYLYVDKTLLNLVCSVVISPLTKTVHDCMARSQKSNNCMLGWLFEGGSICPHLKIRFPTLTIWEFDIYLNPIPKLITVLHWLYSYM